MDPGEIVGIVGRNGAGKTSLLQALARLHRQIQGVIRFDGEDISSLRADQVAIRGMSFVREGARTFEALTIAEHLQLGENLAKRRGIAPVPRDEILTLFPILMARGVGTKAGFLSGGQRQALIVATAIASRSHCLLLDEPSAGLAETVAEALFDKIAEVASQGMTLLIAEQETQWLAPIASRIIELEHGAFVGELDVPQAAPPPQTS